MGKFRLTSADLHPHLLARMQQRGVTAAEIEEIVSVGWAAADAKPGVFGKVWVFPFGGEWEGRSHPEKEVTVYYKPAGGTICILTVKARYGSGFDRR